MSTQTNDKTAHRLTRLDVEKYFNNSFYEHETFYRRHLVLIDSNDVENLTGACVRLRVSMGYASFDEELQLKEVN